MKTLPSAIRAQLDTGVTTFCHCWRIRRTDGAVLGFTDHDHDVVFDGITFRAASGLTPADAERQLGLTAADTEIAGALTADAITEADIAAGKYDEAEIEWWLVDWQKPDNRVLMGVGQLGRVRRGNLHFEAEVRSLATRLGEVRGRVFTHTCDAELGDARCGVDLNDAAWRSSGTVVAIHGADVHLTGLSARAEGFFTQGRMMVTEGAAAGFSAPVLAHRLLGDVAVLTLASAPLDTLVVNDRVIVVAGCDKSFVTCRDTFDNAVNFRGFPHMPGNDFAISYPNHGDDGLDGGSMNR